jgi:hypothetical protein
MSSRKAGHPGANRSHIVREYLCSGRHAVPVSDPGGRLALPKVDGRPASIGAKDPATGAAPSSLADRIFCPKFGQMHTFWALRAP